MTEQTNKETKRFNELISRITYPNIKFEITTEKGRCFLRIKCDNTTCNITGIPTAWNSRKWRLSPHMTDMEIVNTAFLAIITALEHEARELFRVDGIALMDSHRDLNQVLEFMKTGGGHGRH